MRKASVIKKPLIAFSLCAVVFLVVASMSNVVAYPTIKKTDRTRSPHRSEDFLFKERGDIFKKIDFLKHPFFFLIIYRLAQFRLNRGWFLYEISTSIGAFNWMDITHPLLYLRGCWLVISTSEWLNFWGRISYLRGWNWPV